MAAEDEASRLLESVFANNPSLTSQYQEVSLRTADEMLADVFQNKSEALTIYHGLGSSQLYDLLDDETFVQVSTFIGERVLPFTKQEAFGALNLPKDFTNFCKNNQKNTRADAFYILTKQLYYFHQFDADRSSASHEATLQEGITLTHQVTGLDLDRVPDEMLQEAAPKPNTSTNVYDTPASRKVFLMWCLLDMQSAYARRVGNCTAPFNWVHTRNMLSVAEKLKSGDPNKVWPAMKTPSPQELNSLFVELTGRYLT